MSMTIVLPHQEQKMLVCDHIMIWVVADAFDVSIVSGYVQLSQEYDKFHGSANVAWMHCLRTCKTYTIKMHVQGMFFKCFVLGLVC